MYGKTLGAREQIHKLAKAYPRTESLGNPALKPENV